MQTHPFKMHDSRDCAVCGLDQSDPVHEVAPVQPEPDWKEIALQLCQRVNFAMEYLKAPHGAEYMANTKTLDLKHWREYMADGMEMIPGVTVDRTAMYFLDLPKNKQKAAWAEHKEKKAS